MPMAFPPAVFKRDRPARAAILTAGLALFGLLAVVHFHQHHEIPTEELAQTEVSVEVDAMKMPPLPSLKLNNEGSKSLDDLRKDLGNLGEKDDPNHANWGLANLKAHIAAKNPLPLMPPAPRMPPSPEGKAQRKEMRHQMRKAEREEANQAKKHDDQSAKEEKEVDKVEKELEHSTNTKPPTIAGKKHPNVAAVKTGTSTTVTTVPHTTSDPTCCDEWNKKGGPVFVVRKDHCDRAKHCHNRCERAGHDCFCCQQR